MTRAGLRHGLGGRGRCQQGPPQWPRCWALVRPGRLGTWQRGHQPKATCPPVLPEKQGDVPPQTGAERLPSATGANELLAEAPRAQVQARGPWPSPFFLQDRRTELKGAAGGAASHEPGKRYGCCVGALRPTSLGLPKASSQKAVHPGRTLPWALLQQSPGALHAGPSRLPRSHGPPHIRPAGPSAPGDTRGCRSGGCSWHPWALLNILRAQDAPRPRMSDRNPGSIPAQSQVFTPERGSSDRIVPPSGPKPVALPPWPPTGHPPLHLGPRTWGPVRSRLGPGSGQVGLCSRFTLEQPGGRRNWPGTLLTLSRALGRLGPGPAGGQASLQLPSALQTPSRPHEVARAWAGQRPGLWPRTQ